MKRKVLCTIMAAMMVLSACGSKAPEQPSESENKQTEIADSETEGNQAGDTQSEGTQAEDTQKEASGEEDSQKADPTQTEASGQKVAPDLAKLYNRIKSSGAAAGACYIGYNDPSLSDPVANQLAASEAVQAYPFMKNIARDHWVLEPGEDIYCIVPGENVTKVVVYEYNVMDEKPERKVLYESDQCDPFILTANVSDIATNTLIELDTADGHVEYAPSLSLKDGGLYVPESGVIDFSIGANVIPVTQGESVDIGDKELVLYIYEPDEAGNGPMLLVYDGQVLEVEKFTEYMPISYILKNKRDDFYVFAVAGFSNDYMQTHLIHYTKDGGLKDCGMVDGSIGNLADLSEEQVVIRNRVDVFGTYGTYQNYKIKGDKLVLLDTYQDFRNEPDEIMAQYYKEAASDEDYIRQVFDEKGCHVLKVKKDFAAKAASGSKVTIPAGSTIYPKGNKPGEKLFCFSYENQNLEVGYERVKDSYELLIDGIGQEEIFEMLPYAG